MNFYKIRSHAKINLALRVLGKKSFLHKIESIVGFVSFHDEIFIRKIDAKNHKILFYGRFSKNIGKNNTVSKLLKILEEKKLLKNRKFQIKINKKIPTQSGLGGGSMNAANILKYLFKKKIIKIKKKKLSEISKLVGADVAFGLNPKNSILNPKNEIKSFVNYKKIYTLIVKPNFGCSTKYIYSKVRKFVKPKFYQPHKNMFKFEYLQRMNNSLEPIVFFKHPELKKVKSYLENVLNPVFVRMTGSGSAMVAYFNSKTMCDNAKKKFNKKYKNYWCISSKTI